VELRAADPFRGLDFTPEERAALQAGGMDDATAVWAAAGDASAPPLARLAEASGIPRARLQEVLSRAAEGELDLPARSRAVRHWLDAVLLGGVVLLAWLALRDPPRPAEQRHLRAGGSIAAFQVMDSAWLSETMAPAPADAITADSVAHGRVVMRTLAAGQALTEAHLGPALPADALAGRSVLAVSAEPTPADALPRPGSHVGLMLAPRDARGSGVVIGDALVLSAALADSALDLLVALRTADLPAAAALLGNADVHVVAAVP
jgi:hypothetical protein